MGEQAKSAFMPREELLEKAVSKRQITIGIPRDKRDNEKRVSLTPEAVKLLTDSGNEIFIESGAGLGASYTDNDYSDNGAAITDTPQKAYECDIVIKVAPFNEQEPALLKGNQVVISYLNVPLMTDGTLTSLMHSRVTALACERIRDNDGVYPVVESMSEIAGAVKITRRPFACAPLMISAAVMVL